MSCSQLCVVDGVGLETDLLLDHTSFLLFSIPGVWRMISFVLFYFLLSNVVPWYAALLNKLLVRRCVINMTVTVTVISTVHSPNIIFVPYFCKIYFNVIPLSMHVYQVMFPAKKRQVRSHLNGSICQTPVQIHCFTESTAANIKISAEMNLSCC